MTIMFLLKGFVFGLLFSMPLGPLSVLIIQRTINLNRKKGFISGVGIATADTIYSIIAGFSVLLVIDLIRANEFYLRILGAAVLLALAINFLLYHPEKAKQKSIKKNRSNWQYYVSALFITLSNPIIVLIQIGVYAWLQISLSLKHPLSSFLLIFGFFIGTSTWWFTLTGLINAFRKRFTMKIIHNLNKIAGILIILFVVFGLLSTFFPKTFNFHFN